MNKFLSTIFFITAINCYVAQTYLYDSIYFGNRWRTFMTYLPVGYTASVNYPLVLAFHGGGSPNYQTIEYQSRLSLKADTAGFIVVYPEGVKVAGIRTWNAGWCCAPATSLNINDIGFVSKLLDTLFSAKPIDTTRVYATGFSNGSLLCYQLANQLSKRFAAIAPVAGDLMYYPWNPTKATPIISFHSYLDQNIKYFGGLTIGPSGSWFPPQDSIFNIIGLNYACTNLKDTLFHNTNTYDHFKYFNCACNAQIEQYVSYDGSHSWPGGLVLSGPVSNQFSATYLMWQFFQNYTINCSINTSLINNYASEKLMVFPNPTKSDLTINFPNGNFTLIIFDSSGKIVIEKQNIQGKFNFNCVDLKHGLYFIKAQSNKQLISSKFVIE